MPCVQLSARPSLSASETQNHFQYRRGSRLARQTLICVARNRLLFRSNEVQQNKCLLYSGDSRHQHLTEVLKVKQGDPVKVGVVGGNRCTAEVTQLGQAIELTWKDWQAPLPASRVDLLLAMPRPRVMKRLWTHLATLGMGTILITGAQRVEKVYFSSRALRPPVLYEDIIKGLEQAGDTRLPEVIMGAAASRLRCRYRFSAS
ncbi:hypothetical protein WJX72_006074 [[Myrmecia] bisecta]|uniref:16S rRNA (uracil(1498)-N(3))-methyltransferase n=1 Tax=[Myrmecia] bisecta TaxID=41462 RepID=A0AAW1Q4U6_9CHLO